MSLAFRSRSREIEQESRSTSTPSSGGGCSALGMSDTPAVPDLDGGGRVDEEAARLFEAVVAHGPTEVVGMPGTVEQELYRLMRVVHHHQLAEGDWIQAGPDRLSALDGIRSRLDPWMNGDDQTEGIRGPCAHRISAALGAAGQAVRTEWALDEVALEESLQADAGDPVAGLRSKAAALSSVWGEAAEKLLDLDGDALAVDVVNPLTGAAMVADLSMVASLIDLAKSTVDMIEDGKEHANAAKLLADGTSLCVGLTELVLKGASHCLRDAGKIAAAEEVGDLIGGVGGGIVAGLKVVSAAVQLLDGEISEGDLDDTVEAAAEGVGLYLGMGALSFAVGVSWVVFKASLRQMTQTRLAITGAELVVEVDTLVGAMAGVSVAHDVALAGAVRAEEGREGGPDYARAADCLAGAVVRPLLDLQAVAGGLRANVLRGAVSGVFALHGQTLATPTFQGIHALCEDLAEAIDTIVESLPALVQEEAGFGAQAAPDPAYPSQATAA